MTGVIFIDSQEYSVGEGENTVNIVFRRTGDLSGPGEITYQITTDGATAGADFELGYVGAVGSATIPPGDESVVVPITILDDGDGEATEAFVVSLITVSGEFGPTRTSRVFILDDETPDIPTTEPPLVPDYTVTSDGVFSGLSQPIKFTFSPVDPSLAYIAEKSGVVKVADLDTGQVIDTFIDLRSEINASGDRGILGLALHPDFQTNPYVYVFYTVDPPDTAGKTGNAGPDGNGNRFAHLVRFTADADSNYTKVVPGSGVVLVGGAGRTLADIAGGGTLDGNAIANINVPASDRFINDASIPVVDGFKQDYLKVDARSHVGGAIEFGPDGALYVSVGDGITATFADQRGDSVQRLDSLAGKILRIDPITGEGLEDNPFVVPGLDLDSNRAKVFQYGLRNPFSIAFDKYGRLVIADTGWNSYEEVNIGAPGANFGWPYYEGGPGGVSEPTPAYEDFDEAQELYQLVADGIVELTAPFVALPHESAAPGYQVQAITGGAVIYDGDRYPAAFQNDYIFTDFSGGEIYSVDVNDRRFVKFLLDGPQGPVHFVQGADGYIYYADIVEGEIRRLSIVEGPPPLPVRIEAEQFSGIASSSFTIETNAIASDARLIHVPYTSATGSATVTDDLTSVLPGVYDIRLFYVDENDGQGQIVLRLRDASGSVVFTRTIALNQNLGSGVVTINTLTNSTFDNVVVPSGGSLEITATRNGGEFVRIDKIEFEPVGPVGPVEGAVGPTIDIDAAANLVLENAATGALVGIDANAVDPDPEDSVTYSLTNSAAGRFAINAVSGVVTVADGALLDAEAAESHQITVRAASSDGSISSQSFTIAVGDLDEFDVTAPTDANTAANTILESAAAGTVVGITARATDADATQNGITYTLSDDAGGRFVIGATSGVVTVAPGASFDASAEPSVTVVVRAASVDGSTAMTPFTIAIAEMPPPPPPVSTFSVEAESFSGIGASPFVIESNVNASGGRFIHLPYSGPASATIAHSLASAAAGTYDLSLRYVDENDGQAQILVTVRDGGGASVFTRTISLNQNLGSAVATPGTVTTTLLEDVPIPSGGRIELTATRNGGEYVRIDRVDFARTGAPGNAPVGPVSDSDAAANSISENAAVGTTVGIRASAVEPTADEAVSYSLANSAGGRFAVGTTTGVVTVANGALLDAESAGSHQITVQATSADGTSSSQSFTINVTDVDEFDVSAPTDVNSAVNAVLETAAAGASAGITARAADADATNNGVTYSLTDDAGGRFVINGTTGVVTVASGASFDADAEPAVGIEILAASSDGSTATQTFTIDISDAPPPPPPPPPVTTLTVEAEAFSGIGASAFSIENNGNASGGRFIHVPYSGTATATVSHGLAALAAGTYDVRLFYVDENDGQGQISLTVRDGGGAAIFTRTIVLNQNLGSAVATRLTLTSTLFEDVAIPGGASLELSATRNGGEFVRIDKVELVGTAVSGNAPIGPVTDTNAGGNLVAEGASTGTEVGLTARAVEPTAGETVSYSLTNSAGGRFSIGPASGIVEVANGTLLDAESTLSHQITVLATSSDGSSSSQGFTIAVGDVDEFDIGPITDSNSAANSVSEGAAGGTQVGVTARATDNDATTNAVTYGLIDDAGGRFVINATTGVVTVAAGAVFNAAGEDAVAIEISANSADGSSSSQSFTIAVTDLPPPPATSPFTVEAEMFSEFAASPFSIENNGNASGGRFIHLPYTGPASATVVHALDGAGAGIYDLRLFYVDENDGQAQITLRIKNQSGAVTFSEGFTLNQSLGSSVATSSTLTSRLFEDVEIEANASLEITATRNGGEYVRIDKVEAVPANSALASLAFGLAGPGGPLDIVDDGLGVL